MGELKMSSESSSSSHGTGQEQLSSTTPVDLQEFVASGRTGRRNAMVELCNAAGFDQDSEAYKLSEKMAQLATDGTTSKDNNNEAKTS